MKWSQITDVGLVRQGNEDSLCVCGDIGLFAVADGMGGHQAGEVASQVALQIIEKEVRDNLAAGEPGPVLANAFEQANRHVYQLSSGHAELRGMGTTVTACLIAGERLIIAHVGDSRLYLLRDRQISQITEDHSLVQELVRQGGITEAEALTHPQRNVLTKALGTSPLVEVDLVTVNHQSQDRFLICSDGLSNQINPEELKTILAGYPDLTVCLRTLLNLALERGGNDNITMILVEI